MAGSCVQPNDPDSGVIWTFLDITERKKSEAETREALEQQKALNELRTRFVAMTSHEFRTPLSGILSAEELLRHYGDRLPAGETGDAGQHRRRREAHVAHAGPRAAAGQSRCADAGV
jgi:signal transduction histidine kinase